MWEARESSEAPLWPRRSNDYFLAAKAVGAPTTQILVRHVLPNIVAPLIIIFSINVGGVILAEASLSFLGFGLPIKCPQLGRHAQPGGAAGSWSWRHGWRYLARVCA